MRGESRGWWFLSWGNRRTPDWQFDRHFLFCQRWSSNQSRHSMKKSGVVHGSLQPLPWGVENRCFKKSTQPTCLNLMQGTSCMILSKAVVMFAIWESKKTGSTLPSHSKVSKRKETRPWGQSCVWLARKASWTVPATRWCSGTAMSPSKRWGVRLPWVLGNSPRALGRTLAHESRKFAKRI